MAIIVAGYLIIKSGSRDEFIEMSREAILQARENKDCEDFAVSPDPVELNRVNIFEKWKSPSALDIFRDAGPEGGLISLVESFNVNEYEIDK